MEALNQSIECDNCKSTLDIIENPPFVLRKCNHSICEKCKIELTKDIQIDEEFINIPCPLKDCMVKQEINVFHNSKVVEKFQQIFMWSQEKIKKQNEEQLQELLQGKKQAYKFCIIHQDKKIKFFCEKEQTFTCSICTPEHWDHFNMQKCFGQKEIEEYSSFLKSQLEIIIDNYQEKIDFLKISSEQKIKETVKSIQEEFQRQISEIEQNSNVINEKLQQVNNILNTQKKIDSEKIKITFQISEQILKSNFDIINEKQFFQKSLFDNSSTYILDSKIITDSQNKQNLQKLLPEHQKAVLIYRGSRDGYERENFYDKSVNISPSFILIKTKEQKSIFGWYTNISWQKSGDWKSQGGQSFIFKLLNDGTFIKLRNIDKKHEIQQSTISNMLWIGYSGNINIVNDCNIYKKNYSRLGCNNSYETPQGMQPDSEEAQKYLAGEKEFTVEEIELFQLIL